MTVRVRLDGLRFQLYLKPDFIPKTVNHLILIQWSRSANCVNEGITNCLLILGMIYRCDPLLIVAVEFGF